MKQTMAHCRSGEKSSISPKAYATDLYLNDPEAAGDKVVAAPSSPTIQPVSTGLHNARECEISLVRAAQEGNTTAFEELVRRNDRKVYRIARQITRNNEDAEDVVQTAFFKAFRGLGRFQGKSRFSTWLFRITVNECLMKVRQRHGIQAVSLDTDDEYEPVTLHGLVDWRPNPEQLYTQAELRNLLAQALEHLPLRYRTVFLLRDVEGLSSKEAAEVLNLSVSTVKTLLFRARLKLRTRLGRYFHLQYRQEDSRRRTSWVPHHV